MNEERERRGLKGKGRIWRNKLVDSFLLKGDRGAKRTGERRTGRARLRNDIERTEQVVG